MYKILHKIVYKINFICNLVCICVKLGLPQCRGEVPGYLRVHNEILHNHVIKEWLPVEVVCTMRSEG